jgi:hypothetical protein
MHNVPARTRSPRGVRISIPHTLIRTRPRAGGGGDTFCIWGDDGYWASLRSASVWGGWGWVGGIPFRPSGHARWHRILTGRARPAPWTPPQAAPKDRYGPICCVVWKICETTANAGFRLPASSTRPFWLNGGVGRGLPPEYCGYAT